jgi:hypothetical protein
MSLDPQAGQATVIGVSVMLIQLAVSPALVSSVWRWQRLHAANHSADL